MNEQPSPPQGGRSGVLARIALVAAVGVGGFAVTSMVRADRDDAADDAVVTTVPSTTSPAAASPDDVVEREPEQAPAPLVVEVPMRILAPLDQIEPLTEDGDFENVDEQSVQADVVDVLSPAVGVSLVASGGGSSVEEWAPAPPSFAASLGLDVAEPDVDGSGSDGESDGGEVPDIDEVPAIVEISDDALDEVRRAAAREAAERSDTTDSDGEPRDSTDADDGPRLGEPVFPPDDGGFVDPCAETESDECPDPGEPATVVSTFALTAPPPLTVVVTANPIGECAAEVGAEELRVAVESSTPIAEMRFRYWQRFPYNDVEVVTPDDIAATWIDAFDAAVDTPPPPIKHCLTLTNVRSRGANGYKYRVTALDVFDQRYQTPGSEWEAPYITAALRTPATTVWPLTDNEVLVTAPHREEESVRIRAYKQLTDRPRTDPCVSVDERGEGFAAARTPLEMTHSTTEPGRMRAAGLDPAFNHRTGGAMRFDEGSVYRLCVHWSIARPSFAAGLVRSEGYDLTTPDSLETSFAVVSLDVEGTNDAGLDPRDLTIDIAPAGRALIAGSFGCGTWRNSAPITRSVTVEEPICTVGPQSTALYERGAVVSIQALDLADDVHVSRHVIPIRSCTGVCAPPDSDHFRVELPTGAPERDFWCGGLGNACDSPGLNSFGTVMIRVDYDNSRGRSTAAWTVSDPDVFDEEPAELPDEPQMDTSATPRLSGPARSQTITVPILSDRRVSMVAEVIVADGSPVCVRDGGNTSVSDEVLRLERTIEFTGMCPGQTLLLVVTLTAADGATSVWHGAPGSSGAAADAQLWLRGLVLTDWVRWTYESELTFTVPTSNLRVRGLGVSLDGSAEAGGVWHPVRAQNDLTRGCRVGSGPYTTKGLANNNARTRRASTRDEVRFTVVLDVELLKSLCREVDDGFVQPGPLVFRLDLPATEVVVGETYTVGGSVPIAGLPDPDATVDVSATFTIVQST